MKKQLYQSQYILNRVFDNEERILRVTMNTSQDYLNAVYDSSKDAIRVNIDGAAGGVGSSLVYDSVEMLPENATDGQLCPVYDSYTGGVVFYEYNGSTWINRGTTVTGTEKTALQWVNQHLDQLKEVAGYNYIINALDVTLPTDATTSVLVQGSYQNIDDDLNGDNDTTTPYRIDITGYVLSISTYQDENSSVPDRYYTRITYDSSLGGLGTSHIYLQQEEYDHFAAYGNGKNIIRVFYVTNASTSPVNRARYILNADYTVTEDDGTIISALDSTDGDSDDETICRIPVSGYVCGVQSYEDDDALVADKYYTKMVYEPNGIYAGKTYIYMDKEEYDGIAALTNGKNIIDAYFVSSVFPASVTITETQIQFPYASAEFVALDASGNRINVSDTGNKDGDDSTHVRITVSGFVLDVDGYYQSTDTSKKRLIIKTVYNNESDTTDIYLEQEHYEYLCSMPNGRNVISIYTMGAGIGTDSSRIQNIDSSLDATSERAIQNKAVKAAIDAMTTEINSLKARLTALEN